MKYATVTVARAQLNAFSFIGFSALALGLACSNAPSGPPLGTGGGTGSGGQPASGGSGPVGTGGIVGSGGGSSGGSSGSGGGDGTGGIVGSGGAGSGGGGSGGGGSGTAHYNCDPAVGDVPTLALSVYVDEDLLELPIYLTYAPGDTQRLFVLEQEGRILIVEGGVVNPVPFLDIIGQVSMDPWEQGLFGLAFHPDYATNGLFYVHYSANGTSGPPNQANVVSEFQVSDTDPNAADPASERILFTVPTVSGSFTGYHNGGSIFFGMQGELFVALGDGAGSGGGTVPTNPQDLTSLRGKLVRINPLLDGGNPYSFPAGNMIDTNPTALPEIWSYGLRNPYRANMDPCTGDIYIGDVGGSVQEELNIEKAGVGHQNYGWPHREGTVDGPNGGAEPANYRPPFVDYPHDEFGAVIGGAVYRGNAIPGLRGTYFFADLYAAGGGTRTLKYDGSGDTISPVISIEEETNVDQDDQTIVAIQPGPDGELYFLNRGGTNNPNGAPDLDLPSRIYKLVPYVP